MSDGIAAALFTGAQTQAGSDTAAVADSGAVAVTEVTTTPPPEQKTADPAAHAAKPGDWVSKFDEPTRAYMATKGWDKLEAPEAALAATLKSYRNAEELIRKSDKVAVPTDENDAEGWNAWYDRGGRPADAKGLMPKLPDDAPLDKAYLDFMLPELHAAGLNARQTQRVAEATLKYAAQVMAEQDKDGEKFQQTTLMDLEKLKSEMGAAYDGMAVDAQRAIALAQSKGFELADVSAVEKAVGTKKMMALFSTLGGAFGKEARFINGDLVQTGGLTPEAAREQIKTLKGDQTFTKRLMDKDATATAEWGRLHKIGFPEPKMVGAA